MYSVLCAIFGRDLQGGFSASDDTCWFSVVKEGRGGGLPGKGGVLVVTQWRRRCKIPEIREVQKSNRGEGEGGENMVGYTWQHETNLLDVNA